jgi:hypothetical protein
MFAKTIIDSDAFVDMPLSTQALYFHLSMRADDDGFVNNPKKIVRMTGASEDDFKLLIAKRFILTFDSGIIVIKHWRLHNYIQKDRYKPTVYSEEKSLLETKENGVYTFCIQDGYKMDTQVSIGKSRERVSLVEVSGTDGDSETEDVENFEDAENFEEASNLEAMGGALGKGVVYLTDKQRDALLDKLGLDGFNFYIDKLATFILEKDAKVSSHYKTILKWAKEDNRV